jgi:hypothetical protein
LELVQLGIREAQLFAQHAAGVLAQRWGGVQLWNW